MTAAAVSNMPSGPRLRWLPALAVSVAVHAAALIMIRLPQPPQLSAGGGNRYRLTLVSGAAPATVQPSSPAPRQLRPDTQPLLDKHPIRLSTSADAKADEPIVHTDNPKSPRSSAPAHARPNPHKARSTAQDRPRRQARRPAQRRPAQNPVKHTTQHAGSKRHGQRQSASRRGAHRKSRGDLHSTGHTASDASGPGAASHSTGPTRDPRYQGNGLHNPPPVYPFLARRQGQQGEVTLNVKVGPDGNPLRVTIAHSSGYRLLDQAARKAVQKWRFHPALADGRPVAGRVIVPVKFRLTNS